MAELDVCKTRFLAGTWEGIVRDRAGRDARPDIVVSHLDATIESELSDTGQPGEWVLRFAVPGESLADGVQVFLITDRASGEKLDAFTLLAGEPLEDDIRAEVELLRAELDMLKRAFRRHCLEGR